MRQLGKLVGQQLVEKQQIGFQLLDLRPPLGIGIGRQTFIAQAIKGGEQVLRRIVLAHPPVTPGWGFDFQILRFGCRQNQAGLRWRGACIAGYNFDLPPLQAQNGF